MPCFRCSKIPGQADKQGILQQMFRKFQISNRLPNRYFPKIDVGCPTFVMWRSVVITFAYAIHNKEWG